MVLIVATHSNIHAYTIIYIPELFQFTFSAHSPVPNFVKCKHTCTQTKTIRISNATEERLWKHKLAMQLIAFNAPHR